MEEGLTPGPPRHIVLHAKQTVLHFEKRFVKGRLFVDFSISN